MLQIMLCSSCLANMLLPKHTLFTFPAKYAYAPAVTIQAHTSCMSKKASCTKILLTVRMRPAAIALNYSIENIQNDVCQKVCEKSQFDSLVWGLLTLAPIVQYKRSVLSHITLPLW